MKQHETFQEFWPLYVSQHMNSWNRLLHFIGTSLSLITLIHLLWQVILFRDWFLGPIWILMSAIWHIPVALVVGYGFAWIGHFCIEKNRPATFQYPLWSLYGDFKMYLLMWQGRMSLEVNAMDVCIKTFPDSPEKQLGFHSSAKNLIEQFADILRELKLTVDERKKLKEHLERLDNKKDA